MFGGVRHQAVIGQDAEKVLGASVSKEVVRR